MTEENKSPRWVDPEVMWPPTAAGPWIDAAQLPDGLGMYLTRSSHLGDYFLVSVYDVGRGVWYNPGWGDLTKVTHYAVINPPASP